MKRGFNLKLYETTFKNCFIHNSRYQNGNLKLSLFGEGAIGETEHFADITLEQNQKLLNDNEIAVDCLYKPALIPQLKELGILEEQIGICIVNSAIYPIYRINTKSVLENQYCLQEAVAA